MSNQTKSFVTFDIQDHSSLTNYDPEHEQESEYSIKRIDPHPSPSESTDTSQDKSDKPEKTEENKNKDDKN